MDFIIDNYSQYKCLHGHTLQWKEGLLCFEFSLVCEQCSKNYYSSPESILRWKCEVCNTFYCQSCRKIQKLHKCPINHEIPLIKDYKSSSYTCDICFKKLTGTFDTWFDSKCNLGFCLECLPKEEPRED